MKYVLILSGEDYKLALEEIRGVLLQDEKAEFLHMKERLIVIDTVLKKEYLRKRLVLTNIIADFINVCLADKEEIKKIEIKVKGKFAIDQKTIEPEAEIGKIMKALASTIDNKVDLKNPDTTILLLIRKKRAWVGLNPLYKESVQKRMVKNRPFMDPTSMNPKEAKLIINLSGAKEGETLLDPFCGAGGILIEAGLMGIKTYGIELKEEVFEGCKRNLEFYKVKNSSVEMANSL
ncbi:MAG: hypothetical protein JXA43_00850, partial [Candidatus Diapherotrites archaeon]|nr:hypothetical protein [Candidatus Diapherotrites archaeon]